MDFFSDTKGKIKAIKEGVKRSMKPFACLAIGAVMSSCAGTGVTTGSAITTSYFNGSSRVTQTNYVRQSTTNAARENEINSRAVRNYASAFKTVSDSLRRWR